MDHWIEGELCGDARWEDAYRRFETSEQEIRKFTRRLRAAGAAQWSRDSAVVELFCGRGNGLLALQRLGFVALEGVDLSPRLLAQYSGPARVFVGDCRALRFDDQSKDVVVIHGGLHHLVSLPDDLERVLGEIRRVLRRSGHFVAVEPWPTPFLSLVHAACAVPALRRNSAKLDALAEMIELEAHTYRQWLAQPQRILELLNRHFHPTQSRTALGKLSFVGQPR